MSLHILGQNTLLRIFKMIISVKEELSKIENIVGIKEASGNISQVAEIIRICPRDFLVYSGNDDMVIPLMSLGGHGVISVVANILPEETKKMVDEFNNGNFIEARDMIPVDLSTEPKRISLRTTPPTVLSSSP